MILRPYETDYERMAAAPSGAQTLVRGLRCPFCGAVSEVRTLVLAAGLKTRCECGARFTRNGSEKESRS